MDTRRRRADDFTDSLYNFHQVYNKDNNHTASYSEDSLNIDSIRNKHHKYDINIRPKNNETRGSIILAGNLVDEQLTSSFDLYQATEEGCNNAYNYRSSSINDVSDETSYLSIQSGLNKCINLFHNKYLNKESNTSEEYPNISSSSETKSKKDIESNHSNKNKIMKMQYDLISKHPRSVSSLNSLKYASPSKEEIRKSKSYINLRDNTRKDSNYNIKISQFFTSAEDKRKINSHTTKVEKIISSFDDLSLKPSVSSNKKDNFYQFEENQKSNPVDNQSTKEELNPAEFKAFLHSLEDQSSKPSKTVPEHLLRRLSITFYDSPKNFTEKLLTIIEESFVNESDVPIEHPDVSLSRLTSEIRKMCKFIENETAPDWPLSPVMSSPTCKKKGTPTSKSDSLWKSLHKASLSATKSPYLATINTSPQKIKSSEEAYRGTPKSINTVINTESPTQNSLAHDNTSTFLTLEAYCKKLYPEEHGISSISKNQLQSPLQNMNKILRKCNDQMASLENSPNVHEQLRNAETCTKYNLKNQCNVVSQAQNLPYKLHSRKKNDRSKTENIFNTPKQRVESNKHCEMIEPNDLENTLIYEIAKKRQRCLDTAKVMMELNANPNQTEVQQTVSSTDVSEATVASPSANSDAKLMNILMSCKKYQDFLEGKKGLLNLLQRAESCECSFQQNKKNICAKEANRVDIATPGVSKFSTMRKKSTSPSSMRHRSPLNKATVSKPRLFTTPGKFPACSKNANTEKRTYFPNLVVNLNKQKGPSISPHVKNIYRQVGLKYDTVVSPVGMYIRGTDPRLLKNIRPKTDEMLLTPKKKQTSSTSKSEMKFKLSPKRPNVTEIIVGNENVPDNFLHPKVHYKLPTHIRTVKEERKAGNRINELLRSVHDKVVIRHEGRTKTVGADCLKQSEIHYDSAEESVHIEQTARKTCFSCVQKDYKD